MLFDLTQEYDPDTGRFLNGDGYAYTGQEMLGTNMFVYCGSNPVNRIDASGQSWKGLWDEFTETLQQASSYFVVAAGVSQLDSAMPGPADVVSGVLLLGGILVCAGIATYTSITAPAPSISAPKAEERDKVIPAPPPPKKQAFFTVNPYDFVPNGLVMKEYPGTKNGRIIEWRDPVSQAKVFEWDEDLKYGSHYHAMMVEWDGDHHGIHYFPGTPVPEPWNSMYFGGY